MNFIVISAHQPPSRSLHVSADRLVVRATRESRAREAAEALRLRQEEERSKRKGRHSHKRYRETDAYAAAAAAANRSGLCISGTLLRDLCLAEAAESGRPAQREVWATDAVNMGCVLLDRSPALTLHTGLQYVAPADMGEYLFHVQAELLAPGRLVVLSSWTNLEQVAVMPRLRLSPEQRQRQRMAATAYHPYRQPPQQQMEEPHEQQQHEQQSPGQEPSPPLPPQPQPHTVSALPLGQASSANASAEAKTSGGTAAGGTAHAATPLPSPGRSAAAAAASSSSASATGRSPAAAARKDPSTSAWAPRPQQQEAALEVVAAQTSADDIHDLNALIEDGTLTVNSAGPELAGFLCAQCLRLPQTTLTMACCGALLCSRCVPAKTAGGALATADRLCPHCGEEPPESPRRHARRDELLSRLTLELRVLYAPQLRACRRRRASSSSETPRTPDGTNLNSSYLMDTSTLGLL